SQSILEKAKEIERFKQECESYQNELKRIKEKESNLMEKNKNIEEENVQLKNTIKILEGEKAVKVNSELNNEKQLRSSSYLKWILLIIFVLFCLLLILCFMEFSLE
ncbi:hypothetical protein Mgra_00001068, partial [Meloidogyne graminicola]